MKIWPWVIFAAALFTVVPVTISSGVFRSYHVTSIAPNGKIKVLVDVREFDNSTELDITIVKQPSAVRTSIFKGELFDNSLRAHLATHRVTVQWPDDSHPTVISGDKTLLVLDVTEVGHHNRSTVIPQM